MTAAVERARRRAAYDLRNTYRPRPNVFTVKPYVGCPVCEIPTGRVHLRGHYGYIVTLLATASGPEDGARCVDHARTEEQRRGETAAALAWIEAHWSAWLVAE